jgi:uncharacterized protein (TIGR02679 family)
LNFLEEQSAAEETDLAVLAARATGNPHAFDRGTEGGQLLTKALCWWKKAGTPGNTLEYNRLYRDAGIRLDALASRVAAFGLRFYKDDGRLHEGFAGFCREGEPFVVTAANMEHIDRIEAEADKVYIVENEMVFTTLCKAMTGRAVSLLCTSGQLRTVAYQVMDLLAACGCMLYYSGDLDPEGMGIADRLLQRYPQHLHLWHMELEDYRSSLSEELLTSRRLHKLEGLACPQLKAVGEEMSRKKRAGYQEHLIEKMLEDLQA